MLFTDCITLIIIGTLRGGVRNGIGGSDAPATPAGGTSLMDEMAKTLARRRAMCKENSAPNLPLQNGQVSHSETMRL